MTVGFGVVRGEGAMGGDAGGDGDRLVVRTAGVGVFAGGATAAGAWDGGGGAGVVAAGLGVGDGDGGGETGGGDEGGGEDGGGGGGGGIVKVAVPEAVTGKPSISR